MLFIPILRIWNCVATEGNVFFGALSSDSAFLIFSKTLPKFTTKKFSQRSKIMKQNNSNTPPQEESCGKSCLVTVVIFILIIAVFAWGIQFLTNKDNTDTPTFTTRKATTNDINISINDSNLISIEIIVTPKHDIDNLEITINYDSDSNKLLKSVTKDFGDVKKGAKYTQQVYITDFSMSQIFQLSYCRHSVTGGIVSYFS